MPHQRKRHLSLLFKSFENHSPLLGVFGHRQVGKTTFLEEKSKKYLTFDDQETLLEAEKDPKKFLETHKTHLIGIDECQMVPKLFYALKERVRINKRPGQFILSGSVRFFSRQAIKETLTGRIANMELIPLTLSEMANLPPIESIFNILDKNEITPLLNFSSKLSFKERSDLIRKYFERGGLPGICFIRDHKKRVDQISTSLRTILDRDLKLVYPTTLSYFQILNFSQVLAKYEGIPINEALFKRETGISSVTQKKLIHALEAIFMIRLLKLEGDNVGVIPVFEDQAESQFLAGGNEELRMPWVYLIYRNLRETIFYNSGVFGEFFQFQTRGGAKIPLALRIKNQVVGFDYCAGEVPSRSQLASAHSFLGRYNNSKIIFLTLEKKTGKKLKDRVFQMPLENLLFY